MTQLEMHHCLSPWPENWGIFWSFPISMRYYHLHSKSSLKAGSQKSCEKSIYNQRKSNNLP